MPRHATAQDIQTVGNHFKKNKRENDLKLAKLRLPAVIEQIECSPTRNLCKQQLEMLAEGRYLDTEENLLITGSTGCGKSYPIINFITYHFNCARLFSISGAATSN